MLSMILKTAERRAGDMYMLKYKGNDISPMIQNEQEFKTIFKRMEKLCSHAPGMRFH